MDDEPADRCWAMLALGAPEPRGLDVSIGRINDFIGRDQSPGKKRSALLVAALPGSAGSTRAAADRLNRRYGLGLGRTYELDPDDRRRRAARGQAGTVLVLTGDRLPDAELRPAAGVAPVPCDHRARTAPARTSPRG